MSSNIYKGTLISFMIGSTNIVNIASSNSNALKIGVSERRYVTLPEPEPKRLQPNNMPYYRRFERRKPPR